MTMKDEARYKVLHFYEQLFYCAELCPHRNRNKDYYVWMGYLNAILDARQTFASYMGADNVAFTSVVRRMEDAELELYIIHYRKYLDALDVEDWQDKTRQDKQFHKGYTEGWELVRKQFKTIFGNDGQRTTE